MALDVLEFDYTIESVGTGESQTEFNHSQIILEKEFEGIEKGEKTDGMERLLELPLSEYSAEIEEGKYSWKLYNDDMILAAKLQPTSIGKLIQITYTLRIVLDYDTTCSCSTPNTEIGLFISPPRLPSYQELEAPSDWDPQVYDRKDFTDPIPVNSNEE